MFAELGDRARLNLLTLVMATVMALGVGIAVAALYRTGFEAERSGLVELVQSQGRLIASVARFDSIHSQEDYPQGAVSATIDQILAARSEYRGFGETGEFVLAQRSDSMIYFLASVRFGEERNLRALPWDSDLAEAMRLALAGHSGTVVGADYRGATVLAAYLPIPSLQLGIVAKIDLAEIRAPYVKAGAVSGIGAILLLLLGAVLLRRLVSPIIARLKVAARLKDLAVSANEVGEIDELLMMALVGVCDATGWHVGHVYKPAQDGGGELVSTDLWHVRDAERFKAFKEESERTRFARGVGLPGRVWAGRRPEWVTDVTTDKSFVRGDIGVRGAFALPVLGRDEVFAVLEFFCASVEPRDEALLEALSQIGLQLGAVIDRKRAEERLRDSLQMSDDLLRSAPYGIYVYEYQEPDRLILVDANEAAEAMTGIKLRDWKGKEFDEIWPTAREAGLTDVYLKVARSGETFESEDLVYKDRRVDAAFHVHSFTLPNNRLAIAFEDITERRLMEDQLRVSEERFSKAFQTSPNAVTITRVADGYIIDCNQGFETVFGYTRAEALGRTTLDLNLYASQEDRARVIEILERDGRAENLEVELRNKKGQKIICVVEIERIKVGDEDCLVVTTRDITESKQQEEALRESEERFRGAFDTAGHGMALMRMDGSLAEVNPALCEFLGYTEAALLSMSFQEFTHADDLEKDVEQFERLMAGDIRSYQMEKRYIHAEGHVVHGLLNVGLVRDAHGAPVHAVGQVLDLTERKQLEEQLLHSQKMDAIGQLAGGVAHDFNNILTATFGHVELLQMELESRAEADPEVLDHVEQIQKATTRAAELTRQLLTFSRRGIVQPKVLNISRVLEDLEGMLRRLIREDIDLRMKPAPDLWSIRGDPGQVEQVIVNLVVNAADAMPQGGELTLESSNVCLDEDYLEGHAGSKPGAHVRLTVRDTGFGIPEEHRGRIFEPFFTSKPVGEGTGLGLATVHGIVGQAGGHVTVDSEVGVGTTFTIYWPSLEVATPVSDGEELTEKALGGTETILVCDDDPSVGAMLTSSLRQSGYFVLTALRPEEAIELAASHPEPIDLLVTDVIMPGMNGLELADAVRAKRPDIELLLISGYSEDLLSDPRIAEGSIDLLTKPFKPSDLQRKVRDVLGPARKDVPSQPAAVVTRTPSGGRDPLSGDGVVRSTTVSLGDVEESAMKILAVDDDLEVLRILREGLVGEPGGSVELDVCETAWGARECFASGTYDVILLDISLPDGSGLELVGELRAAGDLTPVLMLTSLAAEADIVLGLEAGADDYLTKPFHLSELGARLSALVRRGRSTVLRFDDVELDRVRRTVTRHGVPIRLTPIECKLLETLMIEPGEVTSPKALLRRVWGLEIDPGTSLVRTFITQLRAKLEAHGGARIIGNVPREGYRMIEVP